MVSTAQPLTPPVREGTAQLEEVHRNGGGKIGGLEQLPYQEAVKREHQAARTPSGYVGSCNGDRFPGDEAMEDCVELLVKLRFYI